MSKIKLLSSNLINQIAAGEVVDRPYSVVKELIENSIDAKATQIDINIENGGHKSILVKDNGIGMSKDDLKIAFQRHATSKIKCAKDLENINTLGFRGEALPSIASVARVSAKSTDKNSLNSYRIIIESGETKSFNEVAGVKGTQVLVKDLFYKIPARKKFLKRDDTEQRKIVELVRQYMISNYKIAFTLKSNNKEIFKIYSSNSIEERIKNIFGKNLVDNLLPVSLDKSPYKINGFTGNLNTLKKRHGNQYLFINGRFIKDRLLNSSVFKSYKSLINRGEFPFFALFLVIPTDLIDVNVHPAKLEVRFRKEWHVFHVISSAIKLALKDVLSVIPDYDPSSIFYKRNDNNNHTESLLFDDSINKKSLNNLSNNHKNINSTYIVDSEQSIIEKSNINQSNTLDTNNSMNSTDNEMGHLTGIIWQIENKYLITEIKSGLIIVDQHVAHERILYESAKSAINGNGMASQTVLFPQTLQFQPDEFSSLLDIIPYLEKIGFKLRAFGESSIIIEGIPVDVTWGSEKEVISEILESYIENSTLDASFLDHIAATYACKAAVKAGDPLNSEERRHLIDKLFATSHPYYCPHGRPIIINLSVADLDKRFERH